MAFQGASLVNVKEMAVGDMVSFDLGFDQKKNRPEAININKAPAEFLRCRKLENWMSPVSRPFFLLKSAFRMWIIKQY